MLPRLVSVFSCLSLSKGTDYRCEPLYLTVSEVLNQAAMWIQNKVRVLDDWRDSGVVNRGELQGRERVEDKL